MAKRNVPVQHFKFKVIPRNEVPIRKPIVYQPEDQRGSMYSEILQALSKNPGRAVKIVSKDSTPLADLTNKARRDIKSGLITISKNWEESISTQVEADAVYVFVERE